MIGKMKITAKSEWLENTFDEKIFRRGLSELGWHSDSLKEDVAKFRVIKKEKILELDRISTGAFGKQHYDIGRFLEHEFSQHWKRWMKKLKNLFSPYEMKVVSSEEREIQIPLFWLHSPKVKGSKVTYQESTETKDVGSWKIEVAGTGMGMDASLSVQYSCSFVSSNGDCKLIFAPVPIVISLVETYRKGKLIGRGLRTEVKAFENELEINHGIKSLPENECLKKASKQATGEEKFTLVNDLSRDIHTYERSWKNTDGIAMQIGFDAFQLKKKFEVKTEHQEAIALKFELPAGYNYILLKNKNFSGFGWKVESVPGKGRGQVR
jgi:hypothetical protein